MYLLLSKNFTTSALDDPFSIMKQSCMVSLRETRESGIVDIAKDIFQQKSMVVSWGILVIVKAATNLFRNAKIKRLFLNQAQPHNSIHHSSITSWMEIQDYYMQ